MKNIFSWIVLILFLGIILLPKSVSATTLSQLENELSALKAKQSKTNESKKLTESQIATVKNEIQQLQSKITAIQNEISKINNDIQAKQNKIEEKKEETNEFLKFYQKTSGENTYLEYLFDAEDFTDFIYRFSIVKQLSEYNTNLMKELDKMISELENSKKDLNNKQSELQVQNTKVMEKMALLNNNLRDIESEGSTIEEDIKNKENQIKLFKSMMSRSGTSSISGINVPPSAGWSFPISNFTVTSDYTGYAHLRIDGVGYHHGIDFGKGCGAPVYAVANGTVGTVSWLSGGGNSLYIYHNIGGTQYTSVYMHLSAYGAGIYAGKDVTTNTIIGYVGNTGGNYGCHLHLGLATGWQTSGGFNSHGFDPRLVFPGLPRMESGIVVKGK